MIFLFMTFGTIGLISFQTIKERKNSTILLVAKYKEIDDLNNRYEVYSFYFILYDNLNNTQRKFIKTNYHMQ